MRAFYLLLLAGAALHACCAPRASPAADGAGAALPPPPPLPLPPLCLPRGHPVLALLSPPQLTDALAAAGPLLTWAPLLLLSPPQQPHHAATRRALLACMLAWLLLAWPVRLTKRAHAALHPAAAAHFDPSGHIFLYGLQLVPLQAFAAGEAAAEAAAKPGAQGGAPAGGLPSLLLRRAWAPLLLHLALCTAAFYHTPLESAAAGVGVLFAQALAGSAAAAAALARAPRAPLLLLGAAGAAWALGGAGLLRLLAGAGVAAPRRLPWCILHDAAVLALGALFCRAGGQF
jgi:hypothetical protein